MPILVGNEEKIKQIFDEIEEGLNGIQIYNELLPDEIGKIGVKLVGEGKADIIMKGKLETSQVLRAVVNKEYGLSRGKVMSHFAIQEVPRYHKLLVTTDGGMLVYPTLEQKKDIIENAVEMLLSLGYEKPKVGVLAASETVNPKIVESVDAQQLKKWNEENIIKNCIVEGPISFDLAMVKERAEKKGYDSNVAGDADILVVPNIIAGKILGKSLVEMAGAKMAGIILGAKAPIIVTSRGSSAEEKYLSIALATLAFN